MIKRTGINYTFLAAGVFVLMTAVAVFLGPSPAAAWECSIEVTKTCSDSSGPGEPIYFSGIVTNTCLYPWETLLVTVTDDHAGLVLGPMEIPQGESRSFEGSYVPTVSPSTNTVEAKGIAVGEDGKPIEGDEVYDWASATCKVGENGGGDEGCTPGFWKNHLEDWPAGFSPADSFVGIFGVYLGFDTLGEAVNARGNSIKSLARHAVAALLNAASSEVNYPLTMMEVIAAVQAGDKYTLVDFNEQTAPGFCD